MSGEQLNLPLTFGDSFLEHHAGSIIADPHYALIELVANCWDAGADRVDVEWLKDGGHYLSVKDNGTGMTYEEFTQRWTQLNYNRLKYQGNNVEFPPKLSKRKRIAFGRNGIGRHAMFCFADQYFIETKKNGEFHLIRVERSFQGTPFKLILEDKGKSEGHGTKIYAEAKRNAFELNSTQVSELIGSRFVADPEFNIYVNENFVSLKDIEHLCETSSLLIPEYGRVKLETILHEWSVTDAKKVLDELRYRLDLIKQLEGLVENHTADELHDLQPLFERGLWIFGPEFESISFTSNRSLATVVKKFFGSPNLEHPKKRPDFVILPDSSIGIYACDDFNENHEVSGFKSIVIVELKKGGFNITDKEKTQARTYARELRKSGKVNKSTKIVCYVLGTYVDPLDEETSTDGETIIHPRTYNTVLRQAHARTFNLLRKIEMIQEPEFQHDKELEEFLGTDHGNLFTSDIKPYQTLNNDRDVSNM